jgi:hypothetical protein
VAPRRSPAPAAPAAPLQASSAQAFRARHGGQLVELPSGLVARLRMPPILATTARIGYVPNPLSDAVLKELFLEPAAEETPEAKLAGQERYNRAQIEVAALKLAEPRLMLDRDPNYDAGEIGVTDLSDDDIRFVAGWVEDPAALPSFRDR